MAGSKRFIQKPQPITQESLARRMARERAARFARLEDRLADDPAVQLCRKERERALARRNQTIAQLRPIFERSLESEYPLLRRRRRPNAVGRNMDVA